MLSLLTSISGVTPLNITADQDKAFRAALDSVFPRKPAEHGELGERQVKLLSCNAHNVFENAQYHVDKFEEGVQARVKTLCQVYYIYFIRALDSNMAEDIAENSNTMLSSFPRKRGKELPFDNGLGRYFDEFFAQLLKTREQFCSYATFGNEMPLGTTTNNRAENGIASVFKNKFFQKLGVMCERIEKVRRNPN